jgi:hypothetical protein
LLLQTSANEFRPQFTVTLQTARVEVNAASVLLKRRLDTSEADESDDKPEQQFLPQQFFHLSFSEF